jgi:uncharacterized protein
VRARIFLFLVIVQAVFCLLHYVLYRSLIDFVWAPAAPDLRALQAAFVLLAFCFPLASVLAFEANNVLLRAFYTASAVWIGLASFWFWAACVCWLLKLLAALAHLSLPLSVIARWLFALGTLAAACAVMNASMVRVRRVTVGLPNLPAAWRGRVVALVSDTHLGHVRHRPFIRRIVRTLASLRPTAVFIAGDLYDGTHADLERLASAWRALPAPGGIYFVAGNHEEFGSHNKYLNAVRSAGVRVLDNQKILVEGLQIIGIHYRDTISAAHYRNLLTNAAIDPASASILLTHAPRRLYIPAQAGISLLLCGHTHGGQFLPYTWIVARIFGPFVHGLHRFERMWVFTSYGAGTWGPPLRLGTVPEIVLLELVGL